eukprot:Colp12_sorted_trinity150504_noHs@31430
MLKTKTCVEERTKLNNELAQLKQTLGEVQTQQQTIMQQQQLVLQNMQVFAQQLSQIKDALRPAPRPEETANAVIQMLTQRLLGVPIASIPPIVMEPVFSMGERMPAQTPSQPKQPTPQPQNATPVEITNEDLYGSHEDIHNTTETIRIRGPPEVEYAKEVHKPQNYSHILGFMKRGSDTGDADPASKRDRLFSNGSEDAKGEEIFLDQARVSVVHTKPQSVSPIAQPRSPARSSVLQPAAIPSALPAGMAAVKEIRDMRNQIVKPKPELTVTTHANRSPLYDSPISSPGYGRSAPDSPMYKTTSAGVNHDQGSTIDVQNWVHQWREQRKVKKEKEEEEALKRISLRAKGPNNRDLMRDPLDDDVDDTYSIDSETGSAKMRPMSNTKINDVKSWLSQAAEGLDSDSEIEN